jgi:hypothetical protein
MEAPPKTWPMANFNPAISAAAARSAIFSLIERTEITEQTSELADMGEVTASGYLTTERKLAVRSF